MKMKSIATLALGALALTMGTNCKEAGGCKTDTDCKGDRVCQAGACVDATPATAAPTTAAPVPTTKPADDASTPRKRATPAPTDAPAPEAAPTPSTAKLVPAGSADDLGRLVLDCFHPSATFKGITLTEPYKDEDGRSAQAGRIEFSGGLTGHGYSMDFVMHRKTDAGDKFTRFTPGKDTAFTQPNPKCALRDWTRTN